MGSALRLAEAGKILALVVLVHAAPSAFAGPPSSVLSADVASKVAPSVLSATEQAGEAPVLVLLSAQADLSGAAALPSKEEKGRFVVEALRRTARESQGPVLERLGQLGIP